MENNKTFTPEVIKSMLEKSNLAVERALVAIYDRQTLIEQRVNNTQYLNSEGFSVAHARRGSFYARWIISGRKLSGNHIDKGRNITLHYTKQLAEIANTRRN